MTDLFAQNLKVLAEQNGSLARKLQRVIVPPDFVVVPARNGQPTLIVGGVSFHSRVDPVGEAEAMLAALQKKTPWPAVPVVVFGFGLGYHVQTLARVFKPLMVIEHHLGLIRLAFSLLDFRAVLPRLVFQTDFNELSPAPGTLFVPHPPSAKVFRREFEQWSMVFRPGGDLNRNSHQALSGEVLHAIPGLAGLVDGWKPATQPDLETLINTVEMRRGSLSPAEIYLLLLKELTTGG